ncbi:TetR/AcrR family transcriptional regulator [Kitasatospora sp. NPDC048296]|uniref:TetR/AcrR family transcriptional regulator n=1 Tax=Kitasatospora sp. NPDC048296 TaxID=3364048 RepID=UPI003721531C
MFEENPTNQAPARPTTQRRGIERRQAILDAAEALLTEQGYEDTTLKAIAERAGIPITSVYHYFSDRYEVDAEVLRRHVVELDAIGAAAFGDPALRTLRDAVDATIDPTLEYLRRHRDCAQLWFSGRSERLEELVRDFDRIRAERLRTFLVERDLLRADTPPLALELAFAAGHRLFDIAFHASPTGDDATMAEARRLVTAYLETYSAPGVEGRG